jgi:PAS domain S-box-containing protein
MRVMKPSLYRTLVSYIMPSFGASSAIVGMLLALLYGSSQLGGQSWISSANQNVVPQMFEMIDAVSRRCFSSTVASPEAPCLGPSQGSHDFGTVHAVYLDDSTTHYLSGSLLDTAEFRLLMELDGGASGFTVINNRIVHVVARPEMHEQLVLLSDVTKILPRHIAAAGAVEVEFYRVSDNKFLAGTWSGMSGEDITQVSSPPGEDVTWHDAVFDSPYGGYAAGSGGTVTFSEGERSFSNFARSFGAPTVPGLPSVRSVIYVPSAVMLLYTNMAIGLFLLVTVIVSGWTLFMLRRLSRRHIAPIIALSTRVKGIRGRAGLATLKGQSTLKGQRAIPGRTGRPGGSQDTSRLPTNRGQAAGHSKSHGASNTEIGELSFAIDLLEAEFSRSDALYAEVARVGAQMKQLIDTAMAPIFGVDTELRVTDWNQMATVITGYTKAEVAGRLLVDEFITDEYQQSVRSVLVDALAGRETTNFEFPLFTKSGTRRELVLHARGRRDIGGKVVGVVGVSQDITERKRAEDELERERADLTTRVAERTADLTAANAHLAAASRAKDEFLAGMSHELRTPLNAVLNMSESLKEGIYGPITERQKRPVGLVEESGRHLLSLINDILDLAKVESGTMKLSMETVIAEDVCRASLRFITDLAHAKRVKVTTALGEDKTPIQADERRLKQILVNLLNNAVKFTPEGGSIGLDLSSSSENNEVLFSVWDTGIGISTEEQSRLFKPFVQLDAGLDRRYAGTGLGLSLVERMIELHGGTVQLTSPGHDQGSRFTISLPWSDAMVQFSRHAPDPPMPSATPLIPERLGKDGLGTESDEDGGPLILLAEDNEANITSICDFLQAKGYRIVVARDGVEAIEATRQEHPDLILMDIQMPKLDGLEATREIRQDPDIARVPIVALTALAMSGDRERCLAAGASEYMSKPITLRKLDETIQRLLSADANSLHD